MAVNHLSMIQLVCLLILASANFINAKNIDSSADLDEPGKLIDGPNAGLMLKAMADRQNGCYWDGTAPFCRGSCPSKYYEKSSDSCGDGKCCSRGEKKYCCPKPSNGCYWDGTAPACKGSCPNGFHQKKADKRGDGKYCVTGDKKYCCPNLRLL